MNKYYQPLKPGNFYHLYNRAVGAEKLFVQPMNYAYFLRRMKHHILPIADIYAYSLMPNHFHLLLKVRSRRQLIGHFELKKKREFDKDSDSLQLFAMKQFSNWLNGYVKAFNRMYSRKGGLFMDYCKRTRPDTIEDLKW